MFAIQRVSNQLSPLFVFFAVAQREKQVHERSSGEGIRQKLVNQVTSLLLSQHEGWESTGFRQWFWAPYQWRWFGLEERQKTCKFKQLYYTTWHKSFTRMRLYGKYQHGYKTWHEFFSWNPEWITAWCEGHFWWWTHSLRLRKQSLNPPSSRSVNLPIWGKSLNGSKQTAPPLISNLTMAIWSCLMNRGRWPRDFSPVFLSTTQIKAWRAESNNKEAILHERLRLQMQGVIKILGVKQDVLNELYRYM